MGLLGIFGSLFASQAQAEPSDSVQTHAISAKDKIYIQAGPGSFNDAAIGLLTSVDPSLRKVNRVFAGTPTEAMEMATDNASDSSGFVFVAVSNNLVGLVTPTAAALQKYEIVRVVSGIEMGVEMCVLVPDGVSDATNLTQVASIQPALDQVKVWRDNHGVTTIEEPKGTSAAAEKLSEDQYPNHTGVIGPRKLADVYTNLNALECGIEDKPSATEFALLEVRPRTNEVTLEQAQSELTMAVQELQAKEVEAATIQRLFQLMNQRLSYMEDVAAYKWVNNEPIENVEQEKIVIKSAREKATEQGLNADEVEAFFRLQIELAKKVQQQWHRQWKKDGFPKSQRFDDLTTTVRPELKRIGEDLIAQLKQVQPLLRNPNLRSAIKTLLQDNISTRYISAHDKNKMLRFLTTEYPTAP